MKRVLIVGVGSIGERHLRCFQTTGRAELALCETNAQLRRDVAERYHVSHQYESLDAALQDSFDVVAVCTPAHLHISMARAAVRAGAHVFIEKPLSTTHDGISELAREAKERSRVAGVAYVYRSHPVLQAMRETLLSGRFGEPVQITTTSGQHFPFYRPAYRSIYYNNRDSGGGAVQDALTHIINAGEWMLGPITQLVADLDHQVLEGVTVEDTVHVIARHGSIMGSYSLNQHQAPNEMTMTIVCTKGTVRFEYHANRRRHQCDPSGSWIDEPGEPMERDTMFIRQANAFLDAVEGLSPVQCDLAAAEQTLRVNLAILRSAENHCWETIDTTR